jgi:prepilin-type N-terminal cleavage/methylation domain-containing protein
MRRSLGAHGFTLVELVIALAIVGALLVTAFGGLRVAVGAWRRGDERTETQQHVRTLTLTMARALGATHPYTAARQEGETPSLLFDGQPNRLEFVTQSSPFPTPIPVAFTAVVIELASGDQPKLVIRQLVLPNRDPFKNAPTLLEDESIRTLELGYLGDSGWQTEWNAQTENALPRAIRIGLGRGAAPPGAADRPLPALTVAIGTPKR